MRTPTETKDGGVAVIEPGDNGDGWEIAGIASTYDPDLVGDVVRPGAYAQTLKVRPQVPILWQHDAKTPIGKTHFLVEKRDTGLLFKARLVPTSQGNDARLLSQAGILSVSIGYDAKRAGRASVDGEPYRELQEIDLMEISLVTFAANPQARLTTANFSQRIKDALLVAEVQAGRKSLQSPRVRARWRRAMVREIERMQHGGKTLHELRYDMLYEIQEARKALAAIGV